MTPADHARADQAAAHERDFDNRAVAICQTLLVVVAAFVAYAVLAVYGVVPAAPWSPIGEHNKHLQEDVKFVPRGSVST